MMEAARLRSAVMAARAVVVRDARELFAAAGVTTLNVSLFDSSLEGRIDTLRRVSDALETAGLAD